MTIKTIISAFAVAGLAVTGLCEVSSANIVGYMNKVVNYKNNLGAAPFIQFNVGSGNSYTLENIIPVFKNDDWASGDLQAKTLQSNGKLNLTYVYLTAEDAYWADGQAKAGWFNEEQDTRITGDDALVLAEGEGIILYTEYTDGGVSVTFSGEVAKGSTTYEVGYKNNLQGNVTPLSFEIADIKVGDTLDANNDPMISEDYQSSDIQIKTWQSNGKLNLTYVYLTAEDAYWADGQAKAGWFNEEQDTRLVEENKVEFKAGEGFVVYTELGAAYVQLPAAL